MRIRGINMLVIGVIIVIYTVINVNIFGSIGIGSYTLAFCLQLGLIILSVSPVSEIFLRSIYGFREIRTNVDRNYLLPLFEEVYNACHEYFPKINRNIRLYIDESMEINAYAVGLNTIVVTRGAINALSEEELKGIICHEFGHLIGGDNLISSVLIVGNTLFLFIFLVLKILIAMMRINEMIFPNGGNYHDIGAVLKTINKAIASLIGAISIIFATISRKNEYYADKFAYNVGFVDSIISALYTLRVISNDKMSVIEYLRSSHPYIDSRIERLEKGYFEE